ncbi:MAG: hypothetical protein WCY86_07195 [Spirosomataceae bacterium]
MAGYQYDAELDSRDRSLWSRLIEGDKSALGLLFYSGHNMYMVSCLLIQALFSY